MAQMKDRAVATLIGDVVGSRRARDRAGLHDRLARALREIAPGAVDAPLVTVGDEFQGSYATPGAALDAAWRLRLRLSPDVDVRIGLGHGPVARLDETTQDGPGWWAAREAIDWVKQTQSRATTEHLRTAYRSADEGPEVEAVNAALQCRDHLVGVMDERSLRILAALVAGQSQAAVAQAEGISASAVSQRVRSAGIGVVRLAAEQLAGVEAS